MNEDQQLGTSSNRPENQSPEHPSYDYEDSNPDHQLIGKEKSALRLGTPSHVDQTQRNKDGGPTHENQNIGRYQES